MKRLVPLILLCVLPMLLAAPSVEATPATYQVTYTCDLFGAIFPVDAALARRLGEVPAGFHLRGEESGRALLQIVAARCDPTTVADRSVPAMTYSLASLLTDNDPTATDSDYDSWESTNSPGYHARSEAIGKRSALVEGMTFALDTSAGAPVTASAYVPRPDSPYRISAVIDGVPGPFPDFASEHWYQGPHGRVHKHDDNTSASISPATVTVETTPGTAFYQLIGPGASLPGLFLHFSATATFSIE